MSTLLKWEKRIICQDHFPGYLSISRKKCCSNQSSTLFWYLLRNETTTIQIFYTFSALWITWSGNGWAAGLPQIFTVPTFTFTIEIIISQKLKNRKTTYQAQCASINITLRTEKWWIKWWQKLLGLTTVHWPIRTNYDTLLELSS